MEPKLAFHEKFIKSFYDTKFYKTVINEKMSKTIGYLLILMIFVGMLYNVQIIKVYNSFVDDIEEFIVKDIPEFNISQGSINFKDEGISFRSFNKNGLTIYFDYEGTHEAEFRALDSIGLYLSKDRGFYTSLAISTDIDYELLEGLTKSGMIEIVKSAKSLIVYITIAIFSTLLSMLLNGSMLFLSVFILNLLTNLIMSTKLRFDQVFRLSTYLSTIALSLFLIFSLLYIFSAFTIVIIITMIQTLRVHLFLRPKETEL